ncbi:hypothetical protein [Flagellimonas amoyensis]|uniref:hypothetical protein n=1 Tax=Flagellimonas amoyensis TaxID=2169401 RepID=UPI00131F08C0|nr:hypothetical protein [Allomuricauda amoyensis]
MKKIILILVMLSCTGLQAQLKTIKMKVEPLPRPTITSPRADSEISGPFVLVGKAKPGAEVTVNVVPSYKKSSSNKPVLVKSGEKNLYGPQEFKVRADDKGIWQAPLAEVKFHTGATNREIRVIIGQKLGLSTSETEQYVYKVTTEFVMSASVKGTLRPTDDKVREAFSVQLGTAPVPLKFKAETNTSNPFPIGTKDFKISGSGLKGCQITVKATFDGIEETVYETSKFAGVQVQTKKKTKDLKDKDLFAKSFTIGETGQWSVSSIDPMEDNGKNPNSVGYKKTVMRKINLTVSINNGSKEVLVKNIALTPTPGL